jgi:hypothetical protein
VQDEARVAGRSEPIDLLYPYMDPTLATPTVEADRHREAFDEIERAGATWIMVGVSPTTSTATLEFLDAFGSTYISPT